MVILQIDLLTVLLRPNNFATLLCLEVPVPADEV